MNKKVVNYLAEQQRILHDLSHRRNFWLILVIDVGIVLLAHLLAYAIRFEFSITSELDKFTALIPLIIFVKIPIFYLLGLYRGMWRYTSIADLINISKAVLISSGILIMSLVYINRFGGFSRSVFILDGVFTFLLLCMHRGTIRYIFQNSRSLNDVRNKSRITRPKKKRLLLIGAGAAAEKVIREIHDNQNVPYQVVGMIDDDPDKIGLKIHGIPVIGDVSILEDVVNRIEADELLIAIAAATSEQMISLIDACRSSGIPFKVLPSIGEIIRGRLSVSAIRDVDYRDLLGRPVVKLDQKALGLLVTNQTVLVTGAGGSIGSELCRQLIRFAPAMLILLDASEENLYEIQMELDHEFGFRDYLPVLGKIQDSSLLDAIFVKHGPTLILHAAAYKHVPLMEENPWEAIKNNVVATNILMDMAIKHKALRFVLVSTDKAVRPTNVMGASKRLTELLMQSKCMGDTSTTFVATRFGNVLGSSGSVIPLFKSQISRGGPVTVTDPNVTRYFMSIEEAAQLILQAGTMGQGGEIFILKMGEPVRILDLAKDLITLMGYEPEIDIEIKFTGLRPGEKKYEELIIEGEGIVSTGHDKIMVLETTKVDEQGLDSCLESLSEASVSLDAHEIKRVLKLIIPEYTPDLNNADVFNRKSIISSKFIN